MSKVIIYSNNRIKGLEGQYKNPAYFAGCEKGVDVVYTSHNHIKEAYDGKATVKMLNQRETQDALDRYLENINDDELRKSVSEYANTIQIEYTKKGELAKKTQDALDRYLVEKGAE